MRLQAENRYKESEYRIKKMEEIMTGVDQEKDKLQQEM
jgi:hypothetical protein